VLVLCSGAATPTLSRFRDGRIAIYCAPYITGQPAYLIASDA